MALSWGNSVRDFVGQTKDSKKLMAKEVARIVDHTGMEALRNTRNGTPVRTGRLKAAWRLVLRGKGQKRKAELSNPTPYAIFVEEGTSKMSPRHMLRRAILIAEKNLRKRLKKAEQKVA